MKHTGFLLATLLVFALGGMGVAVTEVISADQTGSVLIGLPG